MDEPKKSGKTIADVDEELLKKFNIKPCQVNLIRADFSKIRITCNAVTSPGEKLSSEISQDGENNFTLRVKRRRCVKDGSQTEAPPVKKEVKKVVQRRQPIPKPKNCTNIVIGEVVLCRMRGFAEWPSFVTSINGNMISVEFFGDHTTHTAAIEHFYIFEESTDTILSNLRKYKRPLYKKSVKEAENALGIPADKSILNLI